MPRRNSSTPRLSSRQHETLKNHLARSRQAVRDALRIHPERASLYPRIPTLKELRGISWPEAKRLNQELRALQKPSDLAILPINNGVVTRFDLKRAQIRERRAEALKARELDRLGIDTSNPYLMGPEELTELLPRQIDWTELTENQFQRMYERVSEAGEEDYYERLNGNYKQSYINSLYYHWDTFLASSAQSRIDKIPAEEFFLLSLQHSEFELDFAYDEEAQELHYSRLMTLLDSLGY